MNAVPLIIAYSRLAKKGARPDVSPLTINFLANFSAHGRLKTRQVRSLGGVAAVRDRERPVIKGIGTLWVAIRPAHPALDRVT